MLISIIIRTYNEERYLDHLLKSISKQKIIKHTLEIILVDSGSTDSTLLIAKSYNCKIKHIKKAQFSFGRSLNLGCQSSNGEILIFISGHCIPVDEYWLLNLINPIIFNNISLTYGKQIGGKNSKFSEKQIFKKYFPNESKLPQNNFFCNNANSAILKTAWEKFKFDEDLTGLEDMHIAKSLFNNEMLIGYVSNSVVYHLHHENWIKIKNRYEREAIALQKIMPEVQISFFDCIRYFITSVYFDSITALKKCIFYKNIYEILHFRSAQYWGSFKGNHYSRSISRKIKEEYFYP
jgi:rhamnosyltransferase